MLFDGCLQTCVALCAPVGGLLVRVFLGVWMVGLFDRLFGDTCFVGFGHIMLIVYYCGIGLVSLFCVGITLMFDAVIYLLFWI